MNTSFRRLGAALGLSFVIAGTAGAAPRSFVVDPAASRLNVHVRKGGMFSFAGHEHDVLATGASGEVVADIADWSKSHVRLSFPTAGLKVDETKEPAGDAAKVQETMAKQVLAVDTYKSIDFASTAVKLVSANKGGVQLELSGTLELHGVTKSLVVPVDVAIEGLSLKAEGRIKIRQSDFAIKPISVAGGTVKVKDELELSFTMVAKEAPAAAPEPAAQPFPPARY